MGPTLLVCLPDTVVLKIIKSAGGPWPKVCLAVLNYSQGLLDEYPGPVGPPLVLQGLQGRDVLPNIWLRRATVLSVMPFSVSSLLVGIRNLCIIEP